MKPPPPQTNPDTAQHRPKEDCHFFHSSAVSGNIETQLGAPHYSYRFAQEKFLDAIQSYGYKSHHLQMPEYYGTSNALPPTIAVNNGSAIHLIFRSTEQIRLLKFAWNICCFAWEFPHLKRDTNIGEHPFLNQTRMLSLCQEVWVPCAYTRAVLIRHGLQNVFVIPAPIDTWTLPRLTIYDSLSSIGDIYVAPLYHHFLQTKDYNKQQCAERSTTLVEFLATRLRQDNDTKIYLTILNPEDFRKNLDALLRAFTHFSAQRNNSILLVKVITSSVRFSLLDVLADVIPNKLDSGTAIYSPNIVFFNDYLPPHAMHALYSIADFYLCASICEGQNLPLLEAMGHGVVPVTTSNTAMADYIDSQNAILIEDHSIPNDCPNLAGTIANKPFTIQRAFAADILRALDGANELSDDQYLAKSIHARTIVEANYSQSAVWKSIQARILDINQRHVLSRPQ